MFDYKYTQDADRIHNLLQEYSDMLIKKGLMLSKKELKSKDNINIINLCEYKTDNPILSPTIPNTTDVYKYALDNYETKRRRC